MLLFWKSVVGKLWLTIIGLVVVVLLILSLFLGQFIDSIFANSKDQRLYLERMADKVASEITLHRQDEAAYIQTVNELISSQDAGMILLKPDLGEIAGTPVLKGAEQIKASRIFTAEELNEVFSGKTVNETFTAAAAGFHNGDFLAIAVPLAPNAQGKISGAVVLYQSVQTLEYTQWYVKRLFFYVAVIGFLMTTFFAFFLSTRITRPLRQLQKAADLITVGEFGTRVPVVSNDEIGELAKTFNHMAQQLQETIKDLHHEKEHLSSVLRSMNDAVVTCNAEGSVILTNPQGAKIIEDWNRIGWNENETGERRVNTPSRLPEPLQPLFRSVVEGARETTSKLHVMNGVWSVVMTPLYSRELVRGAVAVLRDVTEEYRLDKMRSDFVANVSHELRTPLSMLQGYSEALLDDIAGTPEERRELAQVIYDESLRMGRLVKDLLDLARMEAGHMQLNLREIHVQNLINRVYRKFSALAREREIELSSRLPDRKLMIQGDEDRLEQVLTNLLDNALRHTPGGRMVEIRAELCHLKEAEAVKFEIADQGPGIPPEDLPYIFERFYKADKARTRGNSGGTGLGLAIVKNIVEAHQGEVSVRSDLGKGTTFSVIIPLRHKA